MKHYIYTKFEEDDVSQIKELLIELGYNLNLQEITQNIREIRNREGEIFVAKSGEKVIGCVSAIIDVRLAAGMNGEITSLVVSENYRKQGIGKNLIATAENWLSKYVDCIRIRANTIRTDAHKFYTNTGYHTLKTQIIFKKNT